MASGEGKGNKAKLKKELELLNNAMALNKLVKKNDLEGVFLTNPAKESETISDDISDRIIDALEKQSSKEINVLNEFVKESEDERKSGERHTDAISKKRKRATPRKRIASKKAKVKKARRR